MSRRKLKALCCYRAVVNSQSPFCGDCNFLWSKYVPIFDRRVFYKNEVNNFFGDLQMTNEANLYYQIKQYATKILSEYYQCKRNSFADAEDIKKTGKINRKPLPEDKAKKLAVEVTESHLIPDKINDAKDIYRRLLISGQNRNMMPNVIKFMEREPYFKDILHKFNYLEVAKVEPKTLLFKFKEVFKLNENQIKSKNNRPSLWQQYAEFVVSAAKFMTKNSLDYKKSTFDENIEKNKGDLSEAEYIKKEVSHIGYALACDFLKEIGRDMAKPDSHIMAFLEKKYVRSFTEQEAIEKIKELSEGVTDDVKNKIYALDKLIWLCCSGNYYKKNIKIKPKTLRDEFLATL